MINFLFKKNLWTLDLIISIGFSLFSGYILLRDSLTGEPNWEAILYGTLAYIFTFTLAISLQRKISWLRSWIWLGIIGALIRIIFLQLIHFPKLLEYHQRYSPNILGAIKKISSDILIGTTFNWAFWAISGLTFIFRSQIFKLCFFYWFQFVEIANRE